MAEDLAPHLVASPAAGISPHSAVATWAASGAMWLTGRHRSEPLIGPIGVAPFMEALAARLDRLTTALGSPVRLDGPALLGERAAIAGHGRQGEVSCGGASFLLRSADGWIAVSLARDDDRAAVPAWLDLDDGTAVVADDLGSLSGLVARRSTQWLVERACLLGLPCSALDECESAGVPALDRGAASGTVGLDGVTVLDLSSLWAGPLCGQVLAAAGARVIKVESTRRPDGARMGPRAFFDLMHAGKESVALDLGAAGGRSDLARLVDAADVVIEASRPRALEQMGIDAVSSQPRVWLSLTSHGRQQPNRVGFGDDAAVAGGLVARDSQGPVFAGDAAADPIAGLLAATAVLDRLQAGGRWLIDVSLAAAARLAVGFVDAPSVAPEWSGAVAPPRARRVHGAAPPLGAHTEAVLGAL